MNDIYIARMMQNISVTLAQATQEIIALRAENEKLSAENEKLKKLLDFTLVKSGDTSAEQVA